LSFLLHTVSEGETKSVNKIKQIQSLKKKKKKVEKIKNLLKKHTGQEPKMQIKLEIDHKKII
jgi:hypothetical protein